MYTPLMKIAIFKFKKLEIEKNSLLIFFKNRDLSTGLSYFLEIFKSNTFFFTQPAKSNTNPVQVDDFM